MIFAHPDTETAATPRGRREQVRSAVRARAHQAAAEPSPEKAALAELLAAVWGVTGSGRKGADIDSLRRAAQRLEQLAGVKR